MSTQKFSLVAVLVLVLLFGGFSFASAQMYGDSSGSAGFPGTSDVVDPNPGPTYDGHLIYDSYKNGTRTFSGELPYFQQDGYCQYDGTVSTIVTGTGSSQKVNIAFLMRGKERSTSGFCSEIGQSIPFAVTAKASATARVSATVNGAPLAIDLQNGSYASSWGSTDSNEPPCKEIISDDGLTVGCELIEAPYPGSAPTPPCCKSDTLPSYRDLIGPDYPLNDAQIVPPPVSPVYGFLSDDTYGAQETPTASFIRKIFDFFVFWR